MSERIIFPNPDPGEQVQPPMVYVEDEPKWEYRLVTRDLAQEKVLDKAELDQLGAEGWELAGVLTHQSQAFFYFKRLTH